MCIPHASAAITGSGGHVKKDTSKKDGESFLSSLFKGKL
jgi:hypothetical protein